VGWSLFSGMHHAIAAAASRGNNILADHVFVEKAWVDECASSSQT
jgi:chloramphenicol 3-O-phosphotransferase